MPATPPPPSPIVNDAGSPARDGGTVIAVDMGGTKIAGALADAHGHLFARRAAPTWPTDGSPEGLDALIEMIAALRDEATAGGTPARAVGVSVAGVVQRGTGVVSLAPNLGWYDFPLRDALAARFPLPVALGNDAKLATLGEYHAGAGAGESVLVGIWIGTGVGGGIVLDGRIFHGARDAAGEIAYLLPDRTDLSEKYPDLGALELRIAGPGIARRATELFAMSNPPRANRRHQPPTAEDVFAAARAGDTLAGAVVDETLDYLALALSNVVTVLNPGSVLLGGSVGLALTPWYPALAARLTGRIPHVPPPIPAALGGDAPLVGAAALAWQHLRGGD